MEPRRRKARELTLSANALSPLHSRLQSLDAEFAGRDGWQVAERFPEAGTDAAARGVAIADESANGKLQVQGEEAEGLVRTAFAAPALPVGKSASIEALGPGRVCRLRRDLFFIGTAPAEVAAALDRLRRELRASERTGAAVTDLTHGRSELRLVGPAAPELLSKLCGLDFDPGRFLDGDARQSSVARTKQLIVRGDVGGLPSYSLIGGRSLGAYLWDTLMQAGAEFSIAPLGLRDLRALSPL